MFGQTHISMINSIFSIKLYISQSLKFDRFREQRIHPSFADSVISLTAGKMLHPFQTRATEGIKNFMYNFQRICRYMDHAQKKPRNDLKGMLLFDQINILRKNTKSNGFIFLKFYVKVSSPWIQSKSPERTCVFLKCVLAYCKLVVIVVW